ncbi:MAG: 30S ribosomal protein S9 [Candidatus Shikimatogenerans bostrichidophilus]|nr:MAG: 30S ribosomal protein S9 [Candidatus Shikimatogenerans bostrichidophilus]
MKNKIKYYHCIGKRKCSIALIYVNILKNNNKKKYNILINNKTINEYFKNNLLLKNNVIKPLILTNNLNKFNINVKVKGGGCNGQSEAICLAISRVICKIDINNRKIFKPYKMLTRDSRQVERKKFGRKKSRKKFQFSKR